MKSALVVSISDISSDPRPLRAVVSLNEMGMKVDCIGLRSKISIEGVRDYFFIPSFSSDIFSKMFRKLISFFIALIPLEGVKDQLHFHRYNLTNFRTFNFDDYDIIVVEDLFFLPLVLPRVHKAKVVFDAREFYPLQNEERFFFRLFEQPERTRLCQKYLKKCDLNITVSPGLQKEYDRLFGTQMKLIMSTPKFFERKDDIERNDKIRIVHHGAANRNRKIESMIETVKLLGDNYQFDLYLVGTDIKYLKELEQVVSGVESIKIISPVRYEEIIPTLQSYDIGLFLVEPTTFNLKYCLPNKLFEFIQARLMVCVGPSPDMANIVKNYKCGIVLKDFSPDRAAFQLRTLDRDLINRYKSGSDEAAKVLCKEVEGTKFKEMISELI